MYRKNFFCTLLLLFSVALLPLFSQNNTNSPYTRYGYGQLADQTYGAQRGMGGIGYGLRNSTMINPMNPASVSNIDTTTFLFDLGVTAQYGWFKNQGDRMSRLNGNLEYVGMQFPLHKNLGMSVGFKPISYVGYQFGESGYTNGTYFTKSYNGSGGLSKLYGALSYNFFDRLSLGAEMGYVFGDIIHYKYLTPSDGVTYYTSVSDSLRARGLSYNFGIQYSQPLNKDSRLVLGFVYSPKIKIGGHSNNGYLMYTYNSSGYVNVIDQSDTTISGIGVVLPQTLGFGLTYVKDNKLTVGADLTLQRWADGNDFYQKWRTAEGSGSSDKMKNYMKINAGGEYIPDVRDKNLFKKSRYRLGGYYSNSYIDINGSSYKEYGGSIGWGIPLNDSRSYINFAVEYVKIQPDVSSLIDEQYIKFTFSYTFNELWFFKRKLQ